LELRDIFISRVQPLFPFVDVFHVNEHVSEVLRNGFSDSVSSCFVLMIFSLAAIWGRYPDDERRPKLRSDGEVSQTMALPETRRKESSTYFAMAQSRTSKALLDDSLLGPMCYGMMG
jgi:hypothetical protein